MRTFVIHKRDDDSILTEIRDGEAVEMGEGNRGGCSIMIYQLTGRGSDGQKKIFWDGDVEIIAVEEVPETFPPPPPLDEKN